MKITLRPVSLQALASCLVEDRRLAEHFAACARCRQRFQSVLERGPGTQAKGLAEVLPWPDRSDTGYDRAIAEAERRFDLHARSLAKERIEAPLRLNELMEHPPNRRALLTRNYPRFQTWGLWEVVLNHVREQCFTDPLAAEGLAQLGLTLAETLDAGFYGIERIEDLRARTWGYIGNSRRIRFDLSGSQVAFEKAYAHLRQGTGDLLEKGLLLDLQASLRRAQRRFAEAERLMQRALRIYRAVGETHRAGRILVGMSALYEFMGTPERAVALLHEALELIDAEREPRLLWSAHHNLIATLAELGRFMEAQGLFIQARRLYDRFPDGFTQNRRHWLAGRIARGLGQAQKAETHFQTAQMGFISEGAIYDTALVSLELASLFAEQGRTGELKQIAEEMLTIFASQKIHREALAAFSFLHQAAAAERASVEVVSRVAAHVKQLRYNPELTFDPSE